MTNILFTDTDIRPIHNLPKTSDVITIKNYVLIDYENVQPKDLELLSDPHFQVLVFVGANQKTIPIDIAQAIQALGTTAEYIKISGNGKNALDFHIAFYIGTLANKEPKAVFHIISKDTGFDPLIEHLRLNKIRSHRLPDIAEIPILRISNTINIEEKIESIVKNLIGRGASKPKKETTLSNTITSLMEKVPNKTELQNILTHLQSKGYIKIHEGNVTYNLPKKITASSAL